MTSKVCHRHPFYTWWFWSCRVTASMIYNVRYITCSILQLTKFQLHHFSSLLSFHTELISISYNLYHRLSLLVVKLVIKPILNSLSVSSILVWICGGYDRYERREHNINCVICYWLIINFNEIGNSNDSLHKPVLTFFIPLFNDIYYFVI